jgi:hypothetical protein
VSRTGVSSDIATSLSLCARAIEESIALDGDLTSPLWRQGLRPRIPQIV